MPSVVSFWDGRELEFRAPEVIDDFGSVVGLSFDRNCGKVDVAMSAVEVTRILDALMERERKKETPNQDLLASLEDVCDELMDEGIELIAKCVIAQSHAIITPEPPTDRDEFF